MNNWIGRTEALERLGVRPQTLYAYVSRGQIGARPAPEDPRRSLYDAADIDRLAARQKRPRKAGAIAASVISWGEPSLPTRLSTVEKGQLIYRGEDAVALSAHAALEDVAALLWDQPALPAFMHGGALPTTSPFAALAADIESSPASLRRSPAQLGLDGTQAVARLAAGLGLPDTDAPLHQRLARALDVTGEKADLLRQALVLMADHDLNASTFAVRVAASTGASIQACLLAGVATLSGPRHGAAGAALAMLVQQAEQHGVGTALDRWLASGHAVPALGHVLYPQGDARASALLARFPLDPVLSDLRDALVTTTGQLPNIDFALCALTRHLALPDDTPFRLFALGRSIGWVAHAIEQVTTGSLIRPRGRYEGPVPKGG